jgi:biopolymer transport protein ExbD
VPLIDVVFLLLVFFIYAMLSMTVYRGLAIELPRAAGESADPALFVITIGADSSLSVDGVAMSMEQSVETALRSALPDGRQVMVAGDRAAELGVAIELLATLRERGIRNVSFQVRERP